MWKLRCYDHHLCHAVAAISYFESIVDCRPEDIVCITLDGRGDYVSGRVLQGDLTSVAGTTMFDSVGFLWAFVTAALGFKPFRHEGKVLGLAARGDPSRTIDIFRNLLRLQRSKHGNCQWEFRLNWSADSFSNIIPYFAELERDPGRAKATLEEYMLCKLLRGHSREDVAAGLQMFTEDIVLQYLQQNNFVRQNKEVRQP